MTLACLADPLYEVDVAGLGDPGAREGDVAARLRDHVRLLLPP